MITYTIGNDLDLDAVIELYRASTLGERRPVDDRGRMAAMLANANLVVTAWDGDLLVGISRALSDFCYIIPVRFGGPRFAPEKRSGQGIDPSHSNGRRAEDNPAVAGRARRGKILSAHRFHSPSASLAAASGRFREIISRSPLFSAHFKAQQTR